MPGTGTAGFGTGPKEEGVVVSPSDQPTPQRESDDIHAIRERYVLPPTVFPAQVNLAQNAMLKIDMSQYSINAILVTANTGVIFGWFGDFTSANGQAQTFSHFVVSAGIAPASQTIPLPPGNYIVTLQANGGAATGYITAMAL